MINWTKEMREKIQNLKEIIIEEETRNKLEEILNNYLKDQDIVMLNPSNSPSNQNLENILNKKDKIFEHNDTMKFQNTLCKHFDNLVHNINIRGRKSYQTIPTPKEISQILNLKNQNEEEKLKNSIREPIAEWNGLIFNLEVKIKIYY